MSKNTFMWLTFASKVLGTVAALGAIPGVSEHDGLIIFFIASLLKDSINRTIEQFKPKEQGE